MLILHGVNLVTTVAFTVSVSMAKKTSSFNFQLKRVHLQVFVYSSNIFCYCWLVELVKQDSQVQLQTASEYNAFISEDSISAMASGIEYFGFDSGGAQLSSYVLYLHISAEGSFTEEGRNVLYSSLQLALRHY